MWRKLKTEDAMPLMLTLNVTEFAILHLAGLQIHLQDRISLNSKNEALSHNLTCSEKEWQVYSEQTHRAFWQQTFKNCSMKLFTLSIFAFSA